MIIEFKQIITDSSVISYKTGISILYCNRKNLDRDTPAFMIYGRTSFKKKNFTIHYNDEKKRDQVFQYITAILVGEIESVEVLDLREKTLESLGVFTW